MHRVPYVAVMNRSTVVSDTEVAAMVPALQYQVAYHFRPYWNAGVHLYFVPTGGTPASGSYQIVVLDNSDQAGALGYHDLTNEGLPMAKVFAATDKQYGLSVSVTTSHELLEMLADPFISLGSLDNNNDWWAYEVCDPVEADSDGYLCEGIQVSNFITPNWFGGVEQGAKLDYMGQLSTPYSLNPGGYASVWQNGNWYQQDHTGARTLVDASTAATDPRFRNRAVPLAISTAA